MLERILVTLGALAGVSGVAASAAAAHVTGGGQLEIAGRFLLFHAAALIGAAALAGTGLVHPVLGRTAGLVLALGLILFAGDLASRALRGAAIAPMAAPAGGIILMGGWALLGVSAWLSGRP